MTRRKISGFILEEMEGSMDDVVSSLLAFSNHLKCCVCLNWLMRAMRLKCKRELWEQCALTVRAARRGEGRTLREVFGTAFEVLHSVPVM